jgi:hypothetical protein
MDITLTWLLESEEPWTRYRTAVDLLHQSPSDREVADHRAAMLTHPLVQGLLDRTASWPGYAFKRHNDAAHPIYAFSTLADLGLRADDPGMAPGINAVLSRQAPEGPFLSLINIAKAFGGSGEDLDTWVSCDAPTLLYTLLAMGLDEDERVQRAVDHLASLVEENGWQCKASPDLGRFRGPGRKGHPCPIANVYALKALSLSAPHRDGPAVRAGVEMLLGHWEHQTKGKYYLFGIGTDFRKLKYPFVWYDILHVADVLSRFPFACRDPRLMEMVGTITAQADAAGRYTAGSMYRAWKGWSFANKKAPSPWLTFLARRIQKRLGAGGS